MKPDAYKLLSASAKQARSTASQREPAITCPFCATSLMPADLLGHLTERCPDELPEPHPAARWLPRNRALLCGATASALARWCDADLVRTRADGSVLERDLVLCIAWARALGAL